MCWSAYGKDRLDLFQNLTEVLEPLLLNVLGLAAKYRKSQFYWRGHVPPTCEAAGRGERPVGSARHPDNGRSAGADLLATAASRAGSGPHGSGKLSVQSASFPCAAVVLSVHPQTQDLGDGHTS